MYMKSENLIPEFKRKELNLDYISINYEDSSRVRLKSLWSAMEDYQVNLNLKQIVRLMEYNEKSVEYACQLVSLLKEEDFHAILTIDIYKFRDEFNPKSKAEELIFNILRMVCDEIYWIDDILAMDEYEYLNGDNNAK